MSGKPYPEGVTKILAALELQVELEAKIAELEPAVAALANARSEYAKLDKIVCELLQAMDIKDQDNYGFGGRMGWFLGEMRRQMIAAGKKP